MNKTQTTTSAYSQAALRAAFGPGFQAGGPSDATLRVVSQPAKR